MPCQCAASIGREGVSPMDIKTVEIGKHTVSFGNDSAPGEPDAWKYKIDHGMWSPPFDAYGPMMGAAHLDAIRDYVPEDHD